MPRLRRRRREKPTEKSPARRPPPALKIQAAATPSPIKLNIFKLPVAKDLAPRSKNSQPHQKTTGVASANSIHKAARAPIDSRNGGAKCKIISAAPTTAQATSKRRRKSTASGFRRVGRGRRVFRLERHPAKRTIAKNGLLHLRMHRASECLARLVSSSALLDALSPHSMASRPATNFGYRR